MIKKIFYIILVSFVCFFGIDKTYAMVSDISINESGAYNSVNTNGYSIPVSKFTYGMHNFYRFSVSNFNASSINELTIWQVKVNDSTYYNDYQGVSFYVVGQGIQITGVTLYDIGVSCYITNNDLNVTTTTQATPIAKYIYCPLSSANRGTQTAVIIHYSYTGTTSGYVFLSRRWSFYNDNQTSEIVSSIEKNTEQSKKIEESINDTNETLNDDDTSESTSEATSFFEGFDTNTHGLTSIITAPLELIGNIAGSSCSPLPLQVPFVNKTMSLPCMSTIYKNHFGSFLTVYQTITFGIVAYWVCIRIFALVKDFKNPEHDEIEVMDL